MSHGLHSEPSDQWVTQEVTKEILQSGDCGGHAHTRSCINIQWIWPRLVPHSQDYKNVHTFWRHHLWRLNAETHHSAESLQQTHSAYLSDPRSGWQKCLHSSSAGRRKLKMCEQMRVFIFPQRKTWQIVPGGSLTCLLIKLCILKFTQKAETQACACTYTHTHRMTRVNKVCRLKSFWHTSAVCWHCSLILQHRSGRCVSRLCVLRLLWWTCFKLWTSSWKMFGLIADGSCPPSCKAV